MAIERKVVLVTRRTRLEELLRRHSTLAQARFYVEHLGADFGDYEREHRAYARSLEQATAALQIHGRWQIVERSFLPSFQFGATDVVVALGQDGLVANALKYLDGQPLIGLNPEPSRWDGQLLPFEARELGRVLPEVVADQRPLRAVTMAEARLSDGQRLLAVNDLFIGQRGHGSALYDIALGTEGARRETQSSSGVIVATGLGSTAWIRSVVTGSLGIAGALRAGAGSLDYRPEPWDAPRLTFAVREPFPSRASQAGLVFGHVDAAAPLRLRSRMPEQGVIFSDGMEADFLRFTAGMEACIGIAERQGMLVA